MLENTIPKRVSLENWTKNHKTGQFEQVTKIKPATFMKGRAHIEVFDGDGNLEQEAVTENVINNSVNAYFSELLLGSIVGAHSGPKASTTSLFQNIMLNNYTTAESASLKYMPSILDYPIIGWANKITDYAGADSLRGDINKEESSIVYGSTPNVGEITLVFDWNTDQSNGTFQSIFWVCGKSTDNLPYLLNTVPNARAEFSSVGGFVGHVSSYNGYLYTAYNGTIYSIKADVCRSSTYPIGYNSLETVYDYTTEATSPSTQDSVLFDGTYFYVYVRNDNTLYKYDTSWVYQSSAVTINYSTYMADYYRINTDGTNIFTIKRVDATTHNLYKFDMTGSLLNTYNIYTQTGVDVSFEGIYILADGNILILSDLVAIICDTSGTVLTYLSIPITFNHNYAMSVDRELNILWVDSSDINSNGYSLSTLAPSAHTLLASPVTKTSANTMKITYTFSFDLTAL